MDNLRQIKNKKDVEKLIAILDKETMTLMCNTEACYKEYAADLHYGRWYAVIYWDNDFIFKYVKYFNPDKFKKVIWLDRQRINKEGELVTPLKEYSEKYLYLKIKK